jgi:hypothetical protein
VLFIVFLAALAADLVLAGLALRTLREDRRAALDLRDAMATRFTDDPALFELPPERLADLGFSRDDARDVERWRARLAEEVDYLASVSGADLPRDPVERARALVLLFSKNGSPGGCGQYRDLLHNIKRLPQGEGHGCCSDHSEVFLALASVYGLQARESRQAAHTHAEFYDPRRGDWIWVDPLLALMARDEHGDWLSFMEMRRRYLSDEPLEFVFFGTEAHKLSRYPAREHSLYDEKADLAEGAITLGNDVFAQDRFASRLDPLPKEAKQLVGFATGRRPGYLRIVDAESTKALDLQRERTRLIAGGALLLLAHLAWPALRVLDRLRAPRVSGS